MLLLSPTVTVRTDTTCKELGGAKKDDSTKVIPDISESASESSRSVISESVTTMKIGSHCKMQQARGKANQAEEMAKEKRSSKWSS